MSSGATTRPGTTATSTGDDLVDPASNGSRAGTARLPESTWDVRASSGSCDSWAASFDRLHVEVGEPRAVRGWLVAEMRQRGRPRGGTAEIDTTLTHAWRVEDGTIRGWRSFADEEEALATLEPAGAATAADVETVHRGYEAWNRGELISDLLHPEIRWSPGDEAPEAGDFVGRDGFVAFVSSWSESFDDFHLEPEEMIVSGDSVIVKVRQSGRGARQRRRARRQHGARLDDPRRRGGRLVRPTATEPRRWPRSGTHPWRDASRRCGRATRRSTAGDIEGSPRDHPSRDRVAHVHRSRTGRRYLPRPRRSQAIVVGRAQHLRGLPQRAGAHIRRPPTGSSPSCASAGPARRAA